jgi:hypothetical protein
MMKGSELYTAITAIGVVIVIMVSLSFIVQGISQTNVEEKATSEQLMTSSAAYLVDQCFRNGSAHISSDFLDANRRKDVCDLCPSICPEGDELIARIQDLEQISNSWDFGYTEQKVRRDVFVSIIFGNGDVHIGRLYVAIV